jgi:hypothetical protein
MIRRMRKKREKGKSIWERNEKEGERERKREREHARVIAHIVRVTDHPGCPKRDD